jgi:kinesin family protein 6/9
MIPRALSTIFETIDANPDLHIRCFISFLEIYNENIYDLLDRCGVSMRVGRVLQLS